MQHVQEMALMIVKKIREEAEKVDVQAAAEQHVGEQRTLMAVARGLRQAERIAKESISDVTK